MALACYDYTRTTMAPHYTRTLDFIALENLTED